MAEDWEDVKNRVKEANDIVDVVGTYVALRHIRGTTFKGLCPFHNDHNPSFDVDTRRQRYKCWSCGKSGDVISFIQEHDRVDFREALEVLARRAGISLEKKSGFQQNPGRARMLDLVTWAAGQYHQCLLDSPSTEADAARLYLGERRLAGEIVRRFGVGYAPPAGEWLVGLAAKAGLSLELLDQVGLIAQREGGRGYYDRFRDRIMFPIRNARGQTVGFGGRILPLSPLSAKAPKYYNSSDTPIFSKSEQLYGIDLARQATAADGYVAVVEGYTDVLMAHQLGIANVVSTMGTALNARHVKHLRFAPRVVLVFDADAGGATGVDRALEIFVSEEVDLAIATLPDGLDPFDLLVQQGAAPFRQVLAGAVDALDFKLNQVLADDAAAGIEGRRRAVEAVLGIIALAPELSGQAGAIKQELVVSRIARRLALREENLWARLKELRAKRRPMERKAEAPAAHERTAPAAPREKQLLQLLLAEPKLVAVAASEVTSDEIEHPGLRQLLQGLYALHAQGKTPDLEGLRATIDNPALIQHATRLREIGLYTSDRETKLRELITEFRKRRVSSVKQELQNQLQAANDHTEGVELLRRLQRQTVSLESGPLT